MVYLLGATIAGLRLGRGPASVTSMVNVAAFDSSSCRPASHLRFLTFSMS